MIIRVVRKEHKDCGLAAALGQENEYNTVSIDNLDIYYISLIQHWFNVLSLLSTTLISWT